MIGIILHGKLRSIREETRATIEVHHFLSEVPQFWELKITLHPKSIWKKIKISTG